MPDSLKLSSRHTWLFTGTYRRLVRKRIALKGTIGKAYIKEIYPGSILFNFFVRKRRYFSELEW